VSTDTTEAKEEREACKATCDWVQDEGLGEVVYCRRIQTSQREVVSDVCPATSEPEDSVAKLIRGSPIANIQEGDGIPCGYGYRCEEQEDHRSET